MSNVCDGYFEWLVGKVAGSLCSGPVSFRKLLYRLHDIPFRYIIPRDENRAKDGIELRYRFVWENNYPAEVEYELDGPCSVLEMMVALAIRCEETIMDDPLIGDRTPQWFRNMLVNLGLGSMSDDRFDKHYVDLVIDRFLDREYDEDGRGGLFTVRHGNCDLRDVEIAYQLFWYLDELV